MATLYGDDLAYIHDVGFTALARGAAPCLIEAIKRVPGSSSGLVIDLGCGTGVLARAFTEVGLRVLGIDASEAMIARARANAPLAEFRVGSLHEEPLPPAIAITAIGEGIGYLPDGEQSADPHSALARLLARAAAALPPGGLFAFDVMVRRRASERLMRYRTAQQGEDWAVIADISEAEDGATLERVITTYRRADGEVDLYQRSREHHRVALFDVARTRELLDHAGFTARFHRAYGTQPVGPRRRVVLARRR